MSVRRFLGAATGLAAATASAVVFASPAIAATPTINDIDGDGRVDVVIGESIETSEESVVGRVTINYGSGKAETFAREDLGLAADESFGSAIVVANLNGDAYADLVIKSTYHLTVLFGSSSGIVRSGIQDMKGSYGALAVVPKPTPLIVVGKPSDNVNGLSEAGAITVFPVSSAGAVGSGTTITQDTAGVPGTAEANDHFGASLAADDSTLVVGTTGETIGGVVNTGMVTVLHRTGTTTFTGQGFSQNSSGVAGSNTANDAFGQTLAIEDGYLAVGAPGKRLSGLYSAGSVQLFRYTSTTVTPARGFNQNSAGIPGSSESLDWFGSSLAFVRPCAGQRAIAVGARGEDKGAGRVTVVNLSSTASCATKGFGAGQVGLTASTSGPTRAFGQTMAAKRASAASGAADSLLVGAYGLWETKYPFTSTVKTWKSDSDGVTVAAPIAS